MSFLIGLFFFLFGIAIGSFLNVVILRYNTGLSFTKGRSQCFSCGKILEWYELIPLFSFIALGGKCAQCKSKISWQYPLVEFFSGLMFLGVFLKYQYLFNFSTISSATSTQASSSFYIFFIAVIYSVLILSILLVIFVYDIRHKIIPDGLVFLLAAIAFVKLFFTLPSVWQRGSVWDFLAGPLLALPFALLWLVSQGRWMGLGDAKLTLALGWMLGLADGISALILSFWIGALVSLGIMFLQKSKLSFRETQLTMKSEIPFAPFLVIGFILVFFFSIRVLDLSFFIARSNL